MKERRLQKINYLIDFLIFLKRQKKLKKRESREKYGSGALPGKIPELGIIQNKFGGVFSYL